MKDHGGILYSMVLTGYDKHKCRKCVVYIYIYMQKSYIKLHSDLRKDAIVEIPDFLALKEGDEQEVKDNIILLL